MALLKAAASAWPCCGFETASEEADWRARVAHAALHHSRFLAEAYIEPITVAITFCALQALGVLVCRADARRHENLASLDGGSWPLEKLGRMNRVGKMYQPARLARSENRLGGPCAVIAH